MYLIFDTETTGLPRNWNAPISDLSNWPRMVQLAWILYDQAGNEIESESDIIKPNGFLIPQEVVKVHGITTERALQDGEELGVVLRKFINVLDRAEYLIAHNMSFDEKIVGAELIREKIYPNRTTKIKKICTKEISTDYCKIPGDYRYKWPSLSELYFILFKTNFEEAHNATVDVRICARCFFELKRRGVITI